MEPSVFVGVKLTTDQLLTDELVILCNAVSFPDYDFTQLDFYEKIKPLFVSGPTLHEDVKEAIIMLAGKRLSASE